jgi:hypothetical protein
MPRNANNFCWGCYIYSANIISNMLLALLHLFFQNSPIIWAILTGNGKRYKQEGDHLKRQKKHPAPRYEANTHRKTPLLTHLSFRWTLPLSYFLGHKDAKIRLV